MKAIINMKYLQELPEDKKVKIDLKDRKILLELAKNSRIPLTQISKKVGLSRDSVAYRIKNLEKSGIIQGYRTVVDINKFGYTAYHLFISLTKLTRDIENGLIKKFSNFTFVRAVIKFSGKYDYEIAFIASNILELDENINKILGCCSEYIQNYELIAISKNLVGNVFPRNFNIKEGFRAGNKIKNMESPGEIVKDKKNLQILKNIADSANLKLYEISKRCGLSPDAVNYRLKKMLDSGIILKFVPVINFSALSYNVYGLLLNINGLSGEKEMKFKEYLKNDKNTLWAVKTVGNYNVLIYLCVKSADEVHDTIKNIRNLFSRDIKSYETLIAYEEYKYTYFPNYDFI